MNVTVIGAGLAGSEAAWQLADRGIQVTLCEMKPQKMTPAHSSGDFAELVCSNSLRGAGLENAVGLLKEELRRMGSIILRAADELRIGIPDHLSLIGFDNIPSSSLPRIELTTIEQPLRDMAIQAVDMLRDKIEHGTRGYVHQILLPSLVKRSTCKALD